MLLLTGVKRNQTLHSTIVQCDDVCPSKDVISGNPCPVKRVDSRPNRSLCWNNFHCQSGNIHRDGDPSTNKIFYSDNVINFFYINL